MHDLADLIHWARSADLPPRIATALVAALLELAELRRATNRRHLAVLNDVDRLASALRRNGGNLRATRAQFNWSKSQWFRRLKVLRSKRNTSGASSPAPSTE